MAHWEMMPSNSCCSRNRVKSTPQTAETNWIFVAKISIGYSTCSERTSQHHLSFSSIQGILQEAFWPFLEKLFESVLALSWTVQLCSLTFEDQICLYSEKLTPEHFKRTLSILAFSPNCAWIDFSRSLVVMACNLIASLFTLCPYKTPSQG